MRNGRDAIVERSGSQAERLSADPGSLPEAAPAGTGEASCHRRVSAVALEAGMENKIQRRSGEAYGGTSPSSSGSTPRSWAGCASRSEATSGMGVSGRAWRSWRVRSADRGEGPGAGAGDFQNRVRQRNERMSNLLEQLEAEIKGPEDERYQVQRRRDPRNRRRRGEGRRPERRDAQRDDRVPRRGLRAWR